MMNELVNGVFYGTLFISLLTIDYTLGNGIVDMFQKIVCKIISYARSYINDEAKLQIAQNSISLPVLCSEIFFLFLTILFLNKYKQFRYKDRIEDLLQESREAVRQTQEFLEKWRLRRINYQTPSKLSYLDDEPQKIEPFKLEVPILHMAIIDTMGTTRSQPERGDAGDAVNITDSILLSVTSLLDDDLESMTNLSSENKFDENNSMEYTDRYLWDLMEEDFNNLDD